MSLEAEAEFKYRLSPNSNHVNLYFGLCHSLDGWRFLLGFKIVGIKVKLPSHIVTPIASVTTDLFSDAKTEIINTGIVLGTFLVGSFLCHWRASHQEQKRIN